MGRGEAFRPGAGRLRAERLVVVVSAGSPARAGDPAAMPQGHRIRGIHMGRAFAWGTTPPPGRTTVAVVFLARVGISTMGPRRTGTGI